MSIDSISDVMAEIKPEADGVYVRVWNRKTNKLPTASEFAFSIANVLISFCQDAKIDPHYVWYVTNFVQHDENCARLMNEVIEPAEQENRRGMN